MKSKIGPAKLSPNALFSITACPVPEHVRTTADVLAWQQSEHQTMLDEASRLLHAKLVEAFAEFQRANEGMPN